MIDLADIYLFSGAIVVTTLMLWLGNRIDEHQRKKQERRRQARIYTEVCRCMDKSKPALPKKSAHKVSAQ